ncbi:MAG: NAD(P)H-hydrate dehydratase [Treponema sp.]|jgi:NAD(P)H-hydrate epimerase|nr:NAD(P)H-hydrate dehydratase [Treponema sp.]
MKLVSAGQMREIERVAIEEMGVPSLFLMENAALCTVKHCLKFLDGKKNLKVMIVSGSGNNGGDGMAIARLLHVKGIRTVIFFAGNINNFKGDPAFFLDIIRKLGIPVEFELPEPEIIKSFDLVVDAMLGTGLDRNTEGKYKTMIEMINNNAKHIISVDIPSGVHSDSGQIMGSAVKAAMTVTFGLPKTGLYLYPGASYAGKVHIEDISLPVNLIDRIKTKGEILTDNEAAKLLPKRGYRANKGSFGRILIFAGCENMPGAAALCSSASYIAGGGLVRACVLKDVAQVIHHWQREVITNVLPGKNGMYCKKSLKPAAQEINEADVIVLGPGIGRSPDVSEFVHEILSITQKPVVIDADALFAVSENVNILKTLKAPCVITPHPGEMSRLTGLTKGEILDDTVRTAVDFAKEYNVITLLKDARTITANPNGDFFINTTGNNALSKAGTGDVLAGLIAGFISQNLSEKLPGKQADREVFTASVLGAYIHGKAGEAASAELSNYCVTASDLFKYIPQIIIELGRQLW